MYPFLREVVWVFSKFVDWFELSFFYISIREFLKIIAFKILYNMYLIGMGVFLEEDCKI